MLRPSRHDSGALSTASLAAVGAFCCSANHAGVEVCRPSREPVVRAMRVKANDHQVFYAIVGLLAVLVVYALYWQQLASKVLFHDVAMLGDVTASSWDAEGDIASGVNPPSSGEAAGCFAGAVLNVTGDRAELCGALAQAAWSHRKYGFTLFAAMLNQWNRLEGGSTLARASESPAYLARINAKWLLTHSAGAFNQHVLSIANVAAVSAVTIGAG